KIIEGTCIVVLINAIIDIFTVKDTSLSFFKHLAEAYSNGVLLKNGGFITVDGDGFISLTEKGNSVATEMYDRHIWLANFLVNVGVSFEVAAKDACKIEHYISTESFEALKEYAKNTFGEIPAEHKE
ncbi:MAG: hypothetical protein IJO96_09225, partial [Oscillospiraceae bacterium]|nr:hypothetical protein [Oscillospiraceae bacterium]